MKRNRATRGFPYIKERWDGVQPKTTAVSSLHVKPRHRHLAYESDQIDKYAKLIANVDERYPTVDKVPDVSVEELEAMWTGHPSNMSLEMASWSDQDEDGEGGGGGGDEEEDDEEDEEDEEDEDDEVEAAISPQQSNFLKVRSVRPSLSPTFVESELHTRHTMKRSKNKKKSKDIRKQNKRKYPCASMRRKEKLGHDFYNWLYGKNTWRKNSATRGFPYVKERWDFMQPKSTAVSLLQVKPRHRHLAYESDQIDKYARLIANVDERYPTVSKVPEVSVEELEAMYAGHPSNMSLEMASWSDQDEDGEGGGW